MLTHTEKIAYTCLLIASGLLLGYIESLFPVIPFPGIKIGFSNVVILISLFKMNIKWTYIIGVIKSILNGLLFSGILSAVYSGVSIVFSISAMFFLVKFLYPENVSEYGISICGSAVFNILQLCVACLLMKTTAVFYYMPYMIVISIITGLLTAFITKLTLKQI